jgi:iron(III) transport system ATP-binding protein
MSELRLRGLSAGYGADAVLRGVDLTVPAGSITAVLGSSGNGKTTLLRVVAGFLRPTEGAVEIDGRTVAGDGIWVPPERRGVGYVRQEGALFPHLTVAKNIAFGLPFPRGRHRDRVLELLALVGLPPATAERRPEQLSGGQQQRVALARALAPRPALVLLDEPFSSLDTGLRAATRDATARALRASGATAVLVTHDQGEALSFADQVAILESGRFRQISSPAVLYREPIDRTVAAFLGDAMLLPGAASRGRVECVLGTLLVSGFVPDGAVEVMLRPEQIAITAPGAGRLDAVVHAVRFFGHDAVVELDVPDGAGVTVLRARVVGAYALAPGDRVGIDVIGPVRAFSPSGAATGHVEATRPATEPGTPSGE